MKRALVFEARREGYGIDQISNPMTVGELKEILDDFDDDVMIIISHDNGYTYGSVTYPELREEREGEYGTEYVDLEWF